MRQRVALRFLQRRAGSDGREVRFVALFVVLLVVVHQGGRVDQLVRLVVVFSFVLVEIVVLVVAFIVLEIVVVRARLVFVVRVGLVVFAVLRIVRALVVVLVEVLVVRPVGPGHVIRLFVRCAGSVDVSESCVVHQKPRRGEMGISSGRRARRSAWVAGRLVCRPGRRAFHPECRPDCHRACLAGARRAHHGIA